MATTEFLRKRNLFGAIYGLTGGFCFSIVFWGADAIGLASAHASVPFAMFFPGAIICCLVGALLGWVCVKIDRSIVSVLLWVIAAYALVTFVLWLRFAGYQQIMLLFRPDLVGMINYKPPDNFSQYLAMSVIIVGILALICGALENMLVEGALGQSGVGGVVLMVLLCGVLMGFAGNLLSGVVNDDFRNSTRALDKAIHQAISDGQAGVPRSKKRTVVSDILDLGSEVYTKPHRLTLLKYDPFMFVEMHYLVEFGDAQLDCTTIVRKAINCRPIIGK
jgi:hypothetical protein